MGNLIGQRGTKGEVGRFQAMGGSGQPGEFNPFSFNPFQFNPFSKPEGEVTGFAMTDVKDEGVAEEAFELSTRRLVLRPLVADDFVALTELLVANEAPLKASGFTLGAQIGGDREAYAQLLDDLAFLGAIDQRFDFGVFVGDELAGMVGLQSIQRGVVETASVSACGAQAHAGEGYATEALAGLLRLAFEGLGLHRVEGYLLLDNTASARMMTKLGFQDEGIARGWGSINGVWCDHRRVALTQEDWTDERDEYRRAYGV